MNTPENISMKNLLPIQTTEQNEVHAIILAAIFGLRCFYESPDVIDLYKWDDEGGTYVELFGDEIPWPTQEETQAIKQLGKNFVNRVLSGEIKLGIN